MSTSVKRTLLGATVLLCFASALYHGFLMLTLADRGEVVSHLVFRVGFSMMLTGWFAYQFLLVREEAQAATDQAFASIVVLWGSPQLVTAEGLRRAVQDGLGISVPEDAVTGSASSLLWRYREHTFAIQNQRGPYDKAAIRDARCLPDTELRDALDNYMGWMSVELIQFPDGESIETSYRYMGPLVAELTGRQAVALHFPAAGYWAAWQESHDELLRCTDPLAAVNADGLPEDFEIPEGEPALLRAAEQARERWPEFVAAFRSRNNTQSYFVKIRLEEEEEEEFPWLSVAEVEDGTVVGTLDAETATLSYPPGMPIEARLEDVWDWMIVPAGGAAPIGYFAQEALSNAYAG
ncbi:MAG: DUF2314 domain-containing protein [Bryobacterales bacterium]|nr:DUF2314 domain-containing protein [Bryobacterales bacterium]